MNKRKINVRLSYVIDSRYVYHVLYCTVTYRMHLCEDATHTPDIYSAIVCVSQDNFRCPERGGNRIDSRIVGQM